MPPMFRALANHNYRLWAAADLVSVTGTWMQVLGLNWVVMARTGSATSVGVSVLLSTLPALLLGPWAGAIADRVPPRRLLLASQLLHLMIALALASLVGSEAPLAPIYALTALSGLIGTFEGPALGRFAGQVVPRQHLGNALALSSIVNSVGRVLGMSAAGVLAAAVGEYSLFVINAISFLAVIGTILAMRTGELHPLAVSTPDRAGVRAGLRYLRRSRVLIILFALGFALSGLGRNYQVTMAAMSQGPLAGGAAGYGVLSSVFAIGTVLGGLVAARIRELTIPLLLGAAAATSALQALSGLAPGMVGFAALILPIGAGAVLIDTARSTRLQLDSAEDMRGRVVAIQGTVSAAAGATGAPLLGWLCERLGPQPALVLAGLITLAVTFAAVVALRERNSSGEAPPPPLDQAEQRAPSVS
jgi:MFS family permease